MLVEVEVSMLSLILSCCPLLPLASSHPALITLVRVISLLDPLISQPQNFDSSQKDPQEKEGFKGLISLQDQVRHLYQTGTSLDQIVEAINNGLDLSKPTVSMSSTPGSVSTNGEIRRATIIDMLNKGGWLMRWGEGGWEIG